MRTLFRLIWLTFTAIVVRDRLLLWQRTAPAFRNPVLLLSYPISGPLTLWLSRNVGRKIPTIPSELDYQVVEVQEAKLHIYSPLNPNQPQPALIWIHGGGYVAGLAEAEHEVAGRYAEVISGVVVSVDYRLAPEHPFPAALDDCFAALRWLIDNREELNVDMNRIAIGGMSAGGGLAASLAAKAHDAGIAIKHQHLLYPMLDPISAVVADTSHRGLNWNRSSNEYAWQAYLGHHPGIPELREYAAPALRKDLSGLAAAWIGVGESDLFFEENTRYAKRLNEAGVACDLVTIPGMYHAADRIDPNHPEVRRFIELSESALARALFV